MMVWNTLPGWSVCLLSCLCLNHPKVNPSQLLDHHFLNMCLVLRILRCAAMPLWSPAIHSAFYRSQIKSGNSRVWVPCPTWHKLCRYLVWEIKSVQYCLIEWGHFKRLVVLCQRESVGQILHFFPSCCSLLIYTGRVHLVTTIRTSNLVTECHCC